MTVRNFLIAGNWKMHGQRAALAQVRAVADAAAALPDRVELSLHPPFGLIYAAVEAAAGARLAIGAQDCHIQPKGAHTGDISAEMLVDLGARYVIVGHSERRAGHGETDAVVAAKASAARRAGLVPIICIGETLDERDAGRTLDIIGGQLRASTPDDVAAADFVIAYEPVWAIGSGRTPTEGQVAEVHAFLREGLRARIGSGAERVRLLYGGSVKPANAAALLAIGNVDGALVGGASLEAADFLAIARAAPI